MFLIKNIAVTDLAMGIFGVHPSLASLLHGTWPYGEAVCTIFYYIQNPISYVAAVLQVCALHLNKIYTILYPLRTVGRTKALAYRISAAVWILTAVTPVTLILIDSSGVEYDARAYRCMYSFSAPIWEWLLPLMGLAFTAAPNVIVLGTTISLLVLLRKARGRVNKQGILTALFVGIAYFIANGPVSLYVVVYKGNPDVIPSPEDKKYMDDKLYTATSFIMFLNCFTNVFVYYRSVTSFRIFVKSKVILFTKKIFPSNDSQN